MMIKIILKVLYWMRKNKIRFYFEDSDIQEIDDLINKVERAAKIEGRM